MKKQINFVSNLSVKGIISVTILSAMLCTFGANANNKPAVGNAVTMKVESENATESLMNNYAESSNEYKAEDFVNAEMTLESETWLNINSETSDIAIDAEQYKAADFVQADMISEIDLWMNEIPEYSDIAIEAEQYKAADFVKADMTSEIENRMNNSCL